MIERLIALSLVPLWVTATAGSVAWAMALAPLAILDEFRRPSPAQHAASALEVTP